MGVNSSLLSPWPILLVCSLECPLLVINWKNFNLILINNINDELEYSPKRQELKSFPGTRITVNLTGYQVN